MKKTSLTVFKLSPLIFLICCYINAYVTSYSNRPLDQKELSQLFNNLNVTQPTYDSINFYGYSIQYLTNKRNIDFSFPRKKKKPYLVFLHDSGKNASSFINYFKDKAISDNFHLIAIDRPGFGFTRFLSKEERLDPFVSGAKTEIDTESHSFINSRMVEVILSREQKNDEKVRIIAPGNAGLYAAGAYTWMATPNHAAHLFYPKFSNSNTLSLFYKKIVSSAAVSWSLPKSYVNKSKEEIVYDTNLKKDKNYYFDNIKLSEQEWQNSIYTLKDYKAIVFHINSNPSLFSDVKSDVDKIRNGIAFNEIISKEKSFAINEVKTFSVYTDIDQTIRAILSFEHHGIRSERIIFKDNP